MDRWIRLETKLAWQEAQLEQLNNIVTTLNLEMAEHKKLIKLLYQEIQRLENGYHGAEKSRSLRDDIPPHY